MSRFIGLILGLFVFSALPVQALPHVQIQPHKAFYKMSMGKTKQGSSLQDVTGTMAFDWSDMCDSWAQQQHINFRFFYVDGSSSQTKSTIMTSESKDGSDFTFYVKRKGDAEEDETLRGRAQITATGGSAKFSLPAKAKDMALPSGTVFPTKHVLLMIEKAEAGEKLFARQVFDGAEKGGAGEISTFIGARKGRAVKGEVADALLNNPLLEGAAWPMRLAFYEPESKQSEPDYEMDMLMQANGIARSINIDYGEFQIIGRLAKVEKTKRLSCPQKTTK